mmetsp:Transcript_108254/g.312858  ORF Transcript_108254/g.312858 Transcript_108254/m.312858 type:complete len:204 (-) Transcript_108254:573-1184(-)
MVSLREHADAGQARAPQPLRDHHSRARRLGVRMAFERTSRVLGHGSAARREAHARFSDVERHAQEPGGCGHRRHEVGLVDEERLARGGGDATDGVRRTVPRDWRSEVRSCRGQVHAVDSRCCRRQGSGSDLLDEGGQPAEVQQQEVLHRSDGRLLLRVSAQALAAVGEAKGALERELEDEHARDDRADGHQDERRDDFHRGVA